MSKHKVKRKKKEEPVVIEMNPMTYEDYLKYWGEDQEPLVYDNDEE